MRVITVDVYDDFAAVGRDLWEGVARASATDVVFTTYDWQRCWWDAFGRGELHIAVARSDGSPAAIVPMFVDGGMAFLVGSGGSDYLDVVGTSEPTVLRALLATMREVAPIGVRLYHLPDESPTRLALADAADGLGMAAFDEGELRAPRYVLSDTSEWEVLAAKKSLVRHDRVLARDGDLVVEHLRGCAVLPHLDELFAQHVRRWDETPHPSLFRDDSQRRFYRSLAIVGPEWLRFTRVVWNGELAAAHFGFCHRGRYMWYKPSFDPALARRSPGEVLIRRLLLAARDEGAVEFDMGLGEEQFKERFTNGARTVRTWGLYPR